MAIRFILERMTVEIKFLTFFMNLIFLTPDRQTFHSNRCNNMCVYMYIVCLFEYSFRVQPLDCVVYLEPDMSLGALITTFRRPMLRATYEVILYIHLAYGKKVFNLCGN